jgi:HJR/Mrr/RecB family endonuclease
LSATMCIFLKLLWRKTLKVLPKFSLLIFINEELSQKKKNGRERNQGKIKHFNGNHCRRHKN